MTPLLLVVRDAERGISMCQALALEGFAVNLAPEGWYALTMLEREPANLVLVDGTGGAPPAAELAAIVRADRDLDRVRLAVAVGGGEPKPEGFDFVVDGTLPLAELAAALRRVSAARQASDDLVLSGALDGLDLRHLVETLGRCRRTGRLSLDLAGRSVGEVYFDHGRVVHARFGSLTGQEAFVELLAAARREPETPFTFEILRREEVFRYPRTVSGEVGELAVATTPGLGLRRDGDPRDDDPRRLP